MRKFLIFPIIVVLALTFLSVSAVLAQNSTSTDEATLDENVTAEDLDITDPKILPDSPWYGLKKLWENIQEIFTFNPLENAKLQLQRANQRILEAQKLAEKTGNDEAFGRVIENYQRQIEKIEKRLDKLVQKRDAKVDKFIDITLKYDDKVPVISGIKKFSKPGQRIYIAFGKIKQVRGGYGIAIISTSKGLMTNREARKQKLGGELICEVW